MKNFLRLLLCAVLLTGAATTKAQVRYLQEVFADVQVDTSIVYGQNYSAINNFNGLQPLVMDVYRPAGDTATNRPVILLSHNGSFLPENLTAGLLGLCFGGRRDSSLVELCHRFAKRGYVAVSFDYRLGWSATSGVQEVRTATIIRAVYRAMQDAKTLVRYFKNDFSTNGNSYGIDTSRFVIGGSNSGAYVALAASSLNDTSEINAVKFTGTNGAFIKQDTIGDFDGFGGDPAQNHNNYPGYSSQFQCVLALGGAVGDTSWIQPGETPVIAFHGVNETGTPYNTGIVTTTTGQAVIEVSGAGDFMPQVVAKGNNNAFNTNNFLDGPPNWDGAAQTTTLEGLYPFYGQGFEPWNWYATACYNGSSSMQGLNPGASSTKASTYIDTIMGYATPRLYKLLVDPSYVNPVIIGVNEVDENVTRIYPNPAKDQLNVMVMNQPVSSVRLFDIAGRLAKEVSGINSFSTQVNINGMNSGLYLVTVTLADGAVATHRLIIE